MDDFTEGHGEQGFDIATGRSTSPVHVHVREPIYDYACRQLGFTRTIAAWLETKGWRIYALPGDTGSIREFEARNYRCVVGGYLSARWHRVNDVPTYVGDGADTLVAHMEAFDPNCRVTAHRAACNGHECEEPHLHHDDHDTNEHYAGSIKFDGIVLDKMTPNAEGGYDLEGHAERDGELRGYNSAERKAVPIHAFMTGYFPDALWALARLSKKANDKHNPGEPMHWARGKSTDQLECATRHLFTPFVVDPETGEIELAAVAWRALAELQLYEEKRLKKQGIKPLSEEQ